jgi:hypothetical protein
MTPSNDYAFLYDENGKLTVHRLDCSVVRHYAAVGMPVLKTYGCANPLGDKYQRHECLNEHSVETET